MPDLDIVPMKFCASNWGVFEVAGSKPGTVYTVCLGDEKAPATCSCAAFQFQRGPAYERTCKHVAAVEKGACLWSEQGSGNPDATLRPTSSAGRPTLADESCPLCGGPVGVAMVAV